MLVRGIVNQQFDEIKVTNHKTILIGIRYANPEKETVSWTALDIM